MNEEPFCEKKLPIYTKEAGVERAESKTMGTDPAEILWDIILLQLLLK